MRKRGIIPPPQDPESKPGPTARDPNFGARDPGTRDRGRDPVGASMSDQTNFLWGRFFHISSLVRSQRSRHVRRPLWHPHEWLVPGCIDVDTWGVVYTTMMFWALPGDMADSRIVCGCLYLLVSFALVALTTPALRWHMWTPIFRSHRTQLSMPNATNTANETIPTAPSVSSPLVAFPTSSDARKRLLNFMNTHEKVSPILTVQFFGHLKFVIRHHKLATTNLGFSTTFHS